MEQDEGVEGLGDCLEVTEQGFVAGILGGDLLESLGLINKGVEALVGKGKGSSGVHH